MKEVKLICFDVDGTLVDGTSWLILAEGIGCSPKTAFDIFDRARKEEISFIEGERILTKLYQDSGNANKYFIKNLFDNIVIKDEARDLISYLRKKGFRIYLISGAIDIYVESVAKKLNVDGFYANSSLEFDSQGIVQKINYRSKQGKVKVEQLQDLIGRLGTDMNQVVFVGDSENDIEIFKATKHGIAVHSSNEKLKEVSWKIVDSLKQVKNIL